MRNGKEYSAEQRAILAEIDGEWSEEKLLSGKGVEVVVFTSRSNGRGRGPREPRQVILVGYGSKCFAYDPDKMPPYNGLDSQAEEIFAELGEMAYEKLIDVVERAVMGSK